MSKFTIAGLAGVLALTATTAAANQTRPSFKPTDLQQPALLSPKVAEVTPLQRVTAGVCLTEQRALTKDTDERKELELLQGFIERGDQPVYVSRRSQDLYAVENRGLALTVAVFEKSLQVVLLDLTLKADNPNAQAQFAVRPALIMIGCLSKAGVAPL